MKEIGKATPEQIKQWKAKYGDVYFIKAETDDSVHWVYVRKPDMDTIEAVAQKTKTNEVAGARLMLNSIFIGGSEVAIKEQDAGLTLGLMEQIGELTKKAKTSLGKL